MNQHTPKIVPNKNKNPTEAIQKVGRVERKPYEKPEIIFRNKRALQVYIGEFIAKNKNPRFNKRVILL